MARSVQVPYATGNGPRVLLAADLNKDGKADLLVYNAGDGSVTTLLGTGNGTFQPGPSISPPAGAEVIQGSGSMIIGDFNGDGSVDLLIQAPFYQAVALGNGDGTFQTPVTVSISGTPLVYDVNGDGKDDLIATYSSGGLFVQLSNGDGTFAPAIIYGSTFSVSGLGVADLNGDGITDFASLTSFLVRPG